MKKPPRHQDAPHAPAPPIPGNRRIANRPRPKTPTPRRNTQRGTIVELPLAPPECPHCGYPWK